MANKVTVHVIGGQSQILDEVFTVQDVKEKVGIKNATSVVDGAVATDATELADFSNVFLTEAVKGGM